MPVTLKQLFDRVESGAPTEHRTELRRAVLETIAGMGLLVNARTGEVYDPAPKPSYPEQRNVRLRGRRY